MWFLVRASCLTVSLAMLPVSAFGQADDVVRVDAYEVSVELIREVPISTEVAGRIVEVTPAEEGRFVKAGDVLIRLNDSVVQEELKRAEIAFRQKTEIEFAEVSLEAAKEEQAQRYKANEDAPGSFTPSEIRQVDIEAKKAAASLAKAHDEKALQEQDVAIKKAQLDQYTVVAPFDGMITTVTRYPGQNVRQGDPVLTLTDMSVLRARVRVPYKDRKLLFVGDQVEIRVNPEKKAAAQNPRTPASSTPANERIFDDNCGGPGTAEPADPVPQDEEEGVFVGVIKSIDGTLDVRVDVSLVQLIVHVNNRMDKQGRYLLQEGMPADATILARPR